MLKLRASLGDLLLACERACECGTLVRGISTYPTYLDNLVFTRNEMEGGTVEIDVKLCITAPSVRSAYQERNYTTCRMQLLEFN